MRLRVVGLAHGDSFELPVTQTDIGDTTGLSFVHVNRCLQTLRSMNLIDYRSKNIVIKDVQRLVEFTGFNQNYLHLQNEIAL